MKPYVIWHNKILSLGIGLGKLPTGQWDISLSLIFFTIGMQSVLKIDQKDLNNYIEEQLKEQ